MNFLPKNPRSRQLVLLAIAIGTILIGFGFFFLQYFTPATPQEIQQIQAEKGAQGVSESAVKKIEGNITALQQELGNDFYVSLRKHFVARDTTAPGKQNPFIQ